MILFSHSLEGGDYHVSLFDQFMFIYDLITSKGGPKEFDLHQAPDVKLQNIIYKSRTVKAMDTLCKSNFLIS